MDLGALSLPPGGSVPAAHGRPAASARPSWAGRGATVLLWVAVALAAAVAVAAALGIRTEVVLTGSMRPAVAPGDMVVVRGIDAREMRVGDIVSFAAPKQQGVVITHRVRSLHPTRRGRIAVETRGDANNTSEHWTIAPGGHVARVMTVLPHLGRLTGWTGDPATRMVVFLALGGLALLGGLRWIWRDP